MNFQMFKLFSEKAEEPEIKCQYLLNHRKSKSSRKTYISALLTMPKPLTVWITINCGKVTTLQRLKKLKPHDYLNRHG